MRCSRQSLKSHSTRTQMYIQDTVHSSELLLKVFPTSRVSLRSSSHVKHCGVSNLPVSGKLTSSNSSCSPTYHFASPSIFNSSLICSIARFILSINPWSSGALSLARTTTHAYFFESGSHTASKSSSRAGKPDRVSIFLKNADQNR